MGARAGSAAHRAVLDVLRMLVRTTHAARLYHTDAALLRCPRSNHPADTGHATMAPRLTRGEYWLLTKVSEHGLPLRLVGLREGPPWTPMSLQEALNCASHGLDTPTLARHLYRLFRRRWIEFHGALLGTAAKRVIVPDAKGIERELTLSGNFSDSLSYCLTPLGGQVWESFARPDWVRYIEDFSTGCVDDSGADDDEGWDCREVTTADRRTLAWYMDSVRDEDVLRPDSESVEMRHDWEYCYWKPPRSAYVWRFLAKSKKPRRPPSSCWYRDRWCEWR